MLANQGSHCGSLCTKHNVHKPSHSINTFLSQR